MKKSKSSIPTSRKAAAAVLATVVLCSPMMVNPASAATVGKTVEFSTSALTNSIPEGAKVSSSAAAAAVQKLFPELTPSQVTSADYSAYYGTGDSSQTWRLTYNNGSVDGITGEEDLTSVGVDAVTGTVVDAYLAATGSETPVQLTREQASERAMQFLLRAMPEKKAADFVQDNVPNASSGESSFTPLLGNLGYTFSYRIKVNGVPSQPETVVLSLDAGGSVGSYSRSVNHLTYPSASPKVSAEAARKTFESGFGVKLSYIPVNNLPGVPTTYYLGYMPYVSSTAPIDANSGARLDGTTGLPYSQTVGQDGEALKAGTFVTTPLKTEKAAQEQLKKLGLFPDDYKLSGQQTYTQDYPKPNTKIWVLDLMQKGKGKSGSVSVQLNAETGQVYNYYLYDSAATTSVSVQPTEKHKQQAVAWASKLLTNASEWRLTSAPQSGDKALIYNFERYESGIPVQGDTSSVTIGADGTLKEFYASQPSTSVTPTFPAASSVKVTPAEAKTKFLESTKLELYYNQFMHYTSDSSEQDQAEIKLTYVPVLGEKEQLGILEAVDAVDGRWKTIYGSGAEFEPAAAVSDITGHANQAALEEMINHGVLVPDAKGQVNPDAKLTRGEWADMLARALQPDYMTYDSPSGDDLFRDVNDKNPYQAAVSLLVDQGWLTPDKASDFRPNAEMTRDDLGHLLMGVLNYDKLASYYNSTVDLPGIEDAASITNKGDAALAIKLGLLPAVNGSFLPQQAVTKADASVVLKRLADLQGKTDNFMNGNSW
ncbi:hypothetical protein B9G55_18395 [Saccharibacillus sp. O16]|nr:hypothetical protein B9G55_18395 [Saccharibacillus sp. O16]